jgi:hypothetical protein
MSMRRLASLTVAAAATAALAMPGAAGAATTTPSAGDSGNGNTGQYLCVGASLPAQCADLLNNDATIGQHVIIDSSTLGLGLGWAEASQGDVSETGPFTLGSGLNHRYAGRPIYEIQKKTPSGHNGCMGQIEPSGQGFEVAWELCDGIEGNDLNWVLSSEGYLINVGVSNVENDGMPWGLSDQVNGASNGSELAISDDDNPWNLITP